MRFSTSAQPKASSHMICPSRATATATEGRHRSPSCCLMNSRTRSKAAAGLLCWRAISDAGSRPTRSSLGASRHLPAMYKNATGAAPTPKTSAINPTVIKAYRLNRRQGVLRGFFNGRSIKCSCGRQKAGGSQERLSFLPSAYRLTAYCPLLFAFHLLTPQRHHRIHLHRPPSGDITGQQRHSEQKRRRDCECQRVGRPDLEEQRFEEAGESESSRRPDHRADQSQEHPATDDQPEDITRARSERQPNADLARPLRHQIGHYAEQPHRSQQQRDAGEASQQKHIEAARAERVIEQLLDRLDVKDRHVRVNRAQHAAHRRCLVRRLSARADDQTRLYSPRKHGRRDISHRPRLGVRPDAADIAGDADNRVGPVPQAAQSDRPANRVFAGPVAARHLFTDDCHGLALRRVALLKIAPAQWNAESTQVAWTDNPPATRRHAAVGRGGSARNLYLA